MANEFVHIELSTDDVGAAKKFYKTVFSSWEFQAMPKMDYTMLKAGKGAGGGLTKKMMRGQPTAWLPYVEVDDVKNTIARATKAGAKVLVPFQEIGEMGAIGIFMDPTGAALGVWELGKPAKKSAAKKPAQKSTKTSATKKR